MRLFRFAPLLLLVAGCPSDPNVDFCTTVKPAAADVAGRYTLTAQTVDAGGLAVLQGKESWIELRDDGTFTATNVPPSSSDRQEEEFFDTLVSGSGRWQIDSVGSIANAGGKPKTHWGVVFEAENPEIMQMGLTGAAPQFGLLITGDQALVWRSASQHAGPNDATYSTGSPISSAAIHGQRRLRSSLMARILSRDGRLREGQPAL
jgi:hypothetical protein